MLLIWVHGRRGEQALGFMGILSKGNKYNQGEMLAALISIWIVPAGNESGTYTHNTTAIGSSHSVTELCVYTFYKHGRETERVRVS
jgi:hypothetical protein